MKIPPNCGNVHVPTQRIKCEENTTAEKLIKTDTSITYSLFLDPGFFSSGIKLFSQNYAFLKYWQVFYLCSFYRNPYFGFMLILQWLLCMHVQWTLNSRIRLNCEYNYNVIQYLYFYFTIVVCLVFFLMKNSAW